MRSLLRLCALLLSGLCCSSARAQPAPQYYSNLLLDSVGLHFPGGGQLAQPIGNPFRPAVRGYRPSQRFHYPWRAISDAQGQMTFAHTIDRYYDYSAIINRAGDSVSLVAWLNTNLLAVPWPGRPRYTLLLGPTRLTSPALNYAVLDQHGNGGRGWIPDSALHIALGDTVGQYAFYGGLTLARHRSGHGFWVLNRRPSGEVAAYRIDSTGVRRPAVVSRVGLRRRPPDGSYWEGIFLTLNQRRVVISQGYNSAADSLTILALEFNDSTGRLTHPRVLFRQDARIQPDSLLGGLYNIVALSPQGRYAYCRQYNTDPLHLDQLLLYQYDLWAGSAAAVYASAHRLAAALPPHVMWNWGFVGPDARLYLPRYQGSVDVIDCPDQPGPACSYRPEALRLPHRSVTVADNYGNGGGLYGNGFLGSFYPTPYADVLPVARIGGVSVRDEACVRQALTFALTQASALDSARWSFGDNSPTAAGLTVTHAYAQPGRYAVTGIYYYRCAQDTIRRTIIVTAPPAALLLPPDTTAGCDHPTTLRVRAPQGVTWQWLDGAPADSVRAIRTAGTYALAWQAGPCRGREQVTLPAPRPCPAVLLPNILTPDGDGRNDAFVVDAPGPWTLTVYNRWGRPVWRSAPGAYLGEWGGQNLPAGTYYYHLAQEATAASYKGWVEVVR